jgi:hypothetical protein
VPSQATSPPSTITHSLALIANSSERISRSIRLRPEYDRVASSRAAGIGPVRRQYWRLEILSCPRLPRTLQRYCCGEAPAALVRSIFFSASLNNPRKERQLFEE